jgi:hypothetical protein
VPASVLNDYKSIVPWSSFGSIVALTDEGTRVENSEFNIENSELIYDLLGRCVEKAEKGYVDNPRYDYTATMLLFVSFGVLALLFGFWLKIEDKRKGYGLELPNIKE